jgi:SAM-dependent methyltransferase
MTRAFGIAVITAKGCAARRWHRASHWNDPQMKSKVLRFLAVPLHSLRLRARSQVLRWRVLNRIWPRHQCYCCKVRFRRFHPYRQGLKSRPAFLRLLESVGSDVENFRCPFCGSNDRERHLLLYFDRLKLWPRLAGAVILHFVPERNLALRIEACRPGKYIRADLAPRTPDVQPVDITAIPFAGEYFDTVIANHVLEHVREDRRALAEIHRVLKPGGSAVLQTPFSRVLRRTLEDPGINTDRLRHGVYGQEDHVRLYGLDLMERIAAAGFRLKTCLHNEAATREEARLFGMNAQEELMLVQKV